MAIIATAPGPYVLQSLEDTLTFGPGQDVNLDLSDTEAVRFHISSTTGTFTLRGEISLDGQLWIVTSLTTLIGGTLIPVSGSSINNIYSFFGSNVPYFRFVFIAYTDGVITIKNIYSYRTGTR